MFPADFDPSAAASGDGVFGLPCTPEEARVILLPVPFDATTSYRGGAAQGPEAIRVASGQVDLYDAETDDPWRQGLAMVAPPDWMAEANVLARRQASLARVHAGTPLGRSAVEEVTTAGIKVAAWVRAEAERWLEAGKLVGVVGGDHASPYGLIAALAERHPGMGVLHVDAHADLRDAYEGFRFSHASIMHDVLADLPGLDRIVQVSVRDYCEAEQRAIQGSHGRVRTFFDRDLAYERLAGRPFGTLVGAIVETLPPLVYVSFDVDGLDPSLCPGTGTPVPGGLGWNEALFLLAAVAQSGRRLVGFDLCEVAPGGEDGGIDAVVGARLVYKLAGWMLATNAATPPG
jgi:agmatinase